VEGETLNWIDLPPRVEGVIGERIGRLERELREVLTVASVEGEDFTAEVAARVESLNVRSLIRRLSGELERRHRLVSARGIRRLGPQRLSLYRFEHNLFQDYLYDELDEVLRATLHEDVGLALEALYGDQAETIAVQLARHFLLAGVDEKAAVYLRQAGEQAAARFANHQAVDYFRRALELGPAVGPTERFALHFGLGRVLALTGEYDLAVQHLETVYSSFESLAGKDTIVARARVCYHIGRIHERRGGVESLAAALAWQRKGLALLPETPTAEAALLYALGGIVAIRQFDLDRADHECERSLSLAWGANSKPELALAHRLLSISLRAQGRLQEAMAHCDSSIAICEDLTDLMGLATNLSNRGVIAWEMDDWSSAQQSYQEAQAIQEQIGDRYQLAMTCCNLADAFSHLGELEAGIACAQRGLQIYSAIDAPQGVIFARVVLAILLCRKGALKDARAELLKARSLAEAQEDVEFKIIIGRWLGETYLAEGDLNAAEAEVWWLRALGADELGSEFEAVERLWGGILGIKGRLAEAQGVLQESLTRLEEGGERYELGRTLLALGGLLTEMGGDAARDHLERARAIFADLGAAPDTEEVDGLLAGL
jgi:tetratricopeptide (TPR) repeat protein